MPVKVASEWLNSCSGCEVAILNLGETLLTVLPHLEFVHIPVLMDHKYFGQRGEGDLHHLEIPQATVGLISGGIRNQEHLEVAQAMRRSCEIIIALGTCATHGGIPALMNLFDNPALLERYYRTSESTDPHDPPADAVLPPILDRTYALDEKIQVDIYLQGCPPHPDLIAEALTALLEGREPRLPDKSVCDTCPTIRLGKGKLKKLHRFTHNAHYDPAKPLSEMHCLLEQGFQCLGPVTRAGCAGLSGEAPQCIRARVPCQGCYGPVRKDGNQLLDYLNALASNRIDVHSITDRATVLEFSGAHGLLKRRAAGK
ncbi:MAG: methyl viologen-reducing hydrogenase [Syntrophobacterales bacterium]|nr:methyl viologen-reducing hydrogenase [Syntrophobacterales bacterium]